MNGRVAKLTRLPATIFSKISPRIALSRSLFTAHSRTLLLALACAMSLALLGAVRLAPAFRPEPSLAVTESPAAEWNDVAATSNSPADEVVPLGALNREAEPFLTKRPAAGMPEGAELLRAIIPQPPTTPRVLAPRTHTILMEVTAYCACPRCCGPRAQGLTASGRRTDYNGGHFVAADTRLLKFNTKLLIPGYAANQTVEVIDRGGAIKGNKLDVFFPTHQEARQWGRQKLWVTVIEG